MTTVDLTVHYHPIDVNELKLETRVFGMRPALLVTFGFDDDEVESVTVEAYGPPPDEDIDIPSELAEVFEHIGSMLRDLHYPQPEPEATRPGGGEV